MFAHNDPRYFCEPVYGGRSLAYVVYRVASALAFIAMVVHNIIMTSGSPKWFLYLTSWGLVMQMFSTIVQAFITIAHYRSGGKTKSIKTYQNGTTTHVKKLYENGTTTHIKNRYENGILSREPQNGTRDKLNIVYKFSWWLYISSSAASVGVTILYFTLIHTPGRPFHLEDITAHMLNSVFTVVDIYLQRIPVRLNHMRVVFLYNLVYVTLNWIYCAVGGTNEKGQPFIYPYINPNTCAKTAFLIASGIVTVCTLITHICIWLLCIIRDQLVNCLSARTKDTKTH